MLHYLGVKIAVSHFGSYSLSLRYLNAMKVNYLKLDHIGICVKMGGKDIRVFDS